MKRTLTIDIDAPAARVWDILAHQYCDVAAWTDAVQKSWEMDASLVPPNVVVAPEAPVAGRMVVTPLGQLAEVLIEYSEYERTFTFLALGVPGIITRSTDTTYVVETDTGCRVELHIEMVFKGPFKLLDPVLKRRIGNVLNPFLADLKRHAEGTARTEVA